MTKWKIQSRDVAGVGRLFRAVRVIDPTRPAYAENLEVCGEWSPDREAVETSVGELNTTQAGAAQEVFHTLTCPICGGKFVPTAEWAWRHGKKRFCRYHCYLRRGELAQKREKSVRQRTLAGEIVATYPNAAAAARTIGYPVSTVRTACQKGQPLGTGYRWEYVEEQNEKDTRTDP